MSTMMDNFIKEEEERLDKLFSNLESKSKKIKNIRKKIEDRICSSILSHLKEYEWGGGSDCVGSDLEEELEAHPILDVDSTARLLFKIYKNYSIK